ncbi:MotA/TolQ/ExbB proton channel family protein [Sphingomonas aliaeris]|uniref:MotA/TolQ/ExbB proton channel family protein n=1 Tax=Sphingomonas aliaeris TaxID=2759526 RepID=A0A974S404_9SPHN|nr:MotA/TolQ/ExbB proton channel family protein [Sphingomonas aliaeris]QQV77006.1 MotA/TolQ/ExbB proton channel family protein [Sphingomonas aliaeris]
MTFDLASALAPFLDPVAAGIVVGGTVVATMLRTPVRDLADGMAALARLPRRRFDAGGLLDQVGAFTRIARRHGVMALDRSVITDPDVSAAVFAIIDGQGPDDVAVMLRDARRLRTERQLAAVEMWSGAAEVAPAMGMIGTLIGLVAMFTRMTDPSAIGAAMAVALLATLYGAILANLVCSPIAVRLRRQVRVEAVERARLEAPLVALAARARPKDLARDMAHAA